MLDLVPAEVADVDETLNTVLRLGEHTEVGDIADNSLVDGTNGILVADALPRVGGELLQTEGHLPVLAVDGKDLGLDLVADLEELLSGVEPRRPAHLGHMDKTLDTGLDLNESTVVGDQDDLTLDSVTDLDILVEVVPRMRGKLLVTESDPLLAGIELLDDDLDLLVEGDDLLGIVDPAPAEVSDVDETVNTTEVDEHAVVGDVLDSSLKDLTLLELADELGPAGLLLSLEESFMGDDDVAELLVDLDDLEVHGLVDIGVVVTDGLDVDLGAGQEGLDAEHVDDHATLGAGLDEALDDLVVVAGLVDAVPRLEGAGLLVGKDQLTLAVLGGLHIDLDLVSDLQVRIVTELGSLDDTLALVTYIDDNLPLGDGCDGTLDHLVLHDLGESLVIGLLNLFPVVLSVDLGAALEGVPIEILGRDRRVEGRFLCFFHFCLGSLRLLLNGLDGGIQCFFCHNG